MIKNIMSMQRLCATVSEIVPRACFITRYEAQDKDLFILLKEYKKMPFLYLLITNWEDKKCVIYIGKSVDQYNRMLNHNKKYEYDEVYLFAVPLQEQLEAENRLIEAISPLYNKVCNEMKKREIEKLGIHYKGYKSKGEILNDIKLSINNQEMDYAVFYIPQKYVLALKREAEKRKININIYLAEILEYGLPEESVFAAVKECGEKKNCLSELVTAQEYAEIHQRSVEQVKIYCRKRRIPGAFKRQRDWVIPRSAPYPEDRRRK